jgi:hypothetical protein
MNHKGTPLLQNEQRVKETFCVFPTPCLRQLAQGQHWDFFFKASSSLEPAAEAEIALNF